MSTHQEFQVGERVELSPHTDHWARGDRFGVIVKLTSWTVAGVKHYACHVRMDRSGRTLPQPPGNLTHV